MQSLLSLPYLASLYPSFIICCVAEIILQVNVSISLVSQKGDGRTKKSLAELFKPPFDIMFVGTFEEVWITRNKLQVPGFVSCGLLRLVLLVVTYFSDFRN